MNKRNLIAVTCIWPICAPVFAGDGDKAELPKGAVSQLDYAKTQRKRSYGEYGRHFSPDGKLINCGLAIWETKTGKLLHEIGKGGGARYFFRKDGAILEVEIGERLRIRVVDGSPGVLPNGKREFALDAASMMVSYGGYLTVIERGERDTARVVNVFDPDKTIVKHELGNEGPSEVLPDPFSFQSWFRLSPAGDILAYQSRNEQKLFTWQLRGERKAFSWPAKINRHRETFGDYLFSPSGKLLAQYWYPNEIQVLDTTTGKIVAKVPVTHPRSDPRHSTQGKSVRFAFTNDESHLLVSPRVSPWGGFTVEQWSIKERRVVRRFEIKDAQDRIDFLLRFRPLLVAATNKSARPWSAHWIEPSRFPPCYLLSGWHLSPDKRLFVVGITSVTVLDVLTRQKLGEIGKDVRYHTGLTISPCGRYLLTYQSSRLKTVWDLTFGALKESAGKKDLAALWEQLGNSSAIKSRHAMWQFTKQSKDKAVAFLKEKLPPDVLDVDRIQALIKKLDDPNFRTRVEAAKSLEIAGRQVLPLLRAVDLKAASLDARREVKRLIKHFESQRTPQPFWRSIRAVESLERIGTPTALEVLEALAKGAPEGYVTTDAAQAKIRLERKLRPSRSTATAGRRSRCRTT